MERTVSPGAVSGTLTPPCSKSYAQRALAVALLAEGESTIGNITLCDDTRYALGVIRDLGAQVRDLGGGKFAIHGGFRGCLNPTTDTIDVGESGLATRMFTPIASLSSHRITITGRGTMLSRPIGMMIRPLVNLGVAVESDGFLPVTVQGPLRGGDTSVDGSVSSQFVTGLLLALPLAASDSTIIVEHPASVPYMAMTVDMAARFGIRIEHVDFTEFFIPGGQSYHPVDVDIEGDWSCAAFWLVAGAIAGNVTLLNINYTSLQADVAIVEALTRAGAQITTSSRDIAVARRELVAFDFDATQCPDLFPALAVLAANCTGESHIAGAGRLIYKESNRAEAITSQFTRIGIDVTIDGDVMTVRGGATHGGEVESRGDHRIAMAAAIASLRATAPVTIHGAECVAKSYPGFWDELERMIL